MARSRLLVAFDASAIAGAVVSRGLGSPRLREVARVGLPAGALVPSPLETNLQRPETVREALGRLREALPGAGREAALILPDGLARMQLLEVPAGAAPAEFARFRLGPTLPYPVAEAIVDAMPLGRERALAAAVRRAAVEEYEAAAAAAGLEQERIDLAPLAALSALGREGDRGPRVDVILGDAALSLAGFDDAVLRVFRTRRRDPGRDEPDRIRDEVSRTAALMGGASPRRVRVVGPGALALVQHLASEGWTAEPGWDAERDGLPVAPAELPWLGAALF